MRKVTASRMRDRYAQTVLTFRITYAYWGGGGDEVIVAASIMSVLDGGFFSIMLRPLFPKKHVSRYKLNRILLWALNRYKKFYEEKIILLYFLGHNLTYLQPVNYTEVSGYLSERSTYGLSKKRKKKTYFFSIRQFLVKSLF